MLGAIALVVTWSLLLLHESNGWYEFGYRYSVDLVPILFLLFARTYRRWSPPLTAVAAYSVAMNVYGVFWSYVLERTTVD